jgi:hypothetical protein
MQSCYIMTYTVKPGEFDIQGTREEVFWIIKNLYNLIFFKLANSLLELLILVRYAVACHAITVTNHRFTWCCVVINVMCNTVEGCLYQIILGELYDNYHSRADFSFELQIIKVFEITRWICMNFSMLGPKLKLKFKFSQNFELQSF